MSEQLSEPVGWVNGEALDWLGSPCRSDMSGVETVIFKKPNDVAKVALYVNPLCVSSAEVEALRALVFNAWECATN